MIDASVRAAAEASETFRVDSDAYGGFGVFARRALPSGTVLFTEYPLIAIQHKTNRSAGITHVCEGCFRFLGPLERQVGELLCVCSSTYSQLLPDRLPDVSSPAMPAPVPCPGGCNLKFCSTACAEANFNRQHRLLCPFVRAQAASDVDGGLTLKRGRAAEAFSSSDAQRASSTPRLEESLQGMSLASSADGAASSAAGATTAGSVATDVSDAGGASSAAMDTEGGLESLRPTEPLERFMAHAKATNEIFGLAAKAAALVLCKLEGVPTEAMHDTYLSAMAPFSGSPKWWDAVATPDEITDEAAFRRTLRGLLTESWTLLASVLGAHAPPGCPLFARIDDYATIVGAFERRNCAVQVASPVEEYLLLVDALPDGPSKDAVTRVTAPILDALGDAYATPLEGAGLFPLQATLNHNCEPNVTLVKEEGEEERDGRVVARLTRDVAEGEELCNAYVDISLPVRRRRRELREYGFECMCERCVREAAIADQKKADKKAGKKRLK